MMSRCSLNSFSTAPSSAFCDVIEALAFVDVMTLRAQARLEPGVLLLVSSAESSSCLHALLGSDFSYSMLKLEPMTVMGSARIRMPHSMETSEELALGRIGV